MVKSSKIIRVPFRDQKEWEEFCKKLLLRSAYIGISGSNLFTICSSKLKGQDPSQSGTTNKLNLSIRPSYSVNLGVTF